MTLTLSGLAAEFPHVPPQIEFSLHDPAQCGMIPSQQPVDHAVCVKCGRWAHQVTLEFWQCLPCGWFGKLEGEPPDPPQGQGRRKRRRT